MSNMPTFFNTELIELEKDPSQMLLVLFRITHVGFPEIYLQIWVVLKLSQAGLSDMKFEGIVILRVKNHAESCCLEAKGFY